jgi:hypothetical protein
MEDASAVDLDWFWNGWFYSTDHVDVSIDSMTTITALMQRADMAELSPQDFIVLAPSGGAAQRAILEDRATPAALEAALSTNTALSDAREFKEYFYRVELSNPGGLVTPLTFKADFDNGQSQLFHLPAEIWKRSSQRANKVLITNLPIRKLTFDPLRETGDANIRNNVFPRSGASLTSSSSDGLNDLLVPELSDKLKPRWKTDGWSPHPGVRWNVPDAPSVNHHMEPKAEH